jgi:hypothetical protein
MTDAQRQLEAARQDAGRKGRVVFGYRPAIGLPSHPDGSLKLIVETVPSKTWNRMIGGDIVPEPSPSRQGALL